MDMENLPLALLSSLVVALIIIGAIFFLSQISRIFVKSNSVKAVKFYFHTKKMRTIGEQFDQLYLTSVVFVVLIIIGIILMTPLYAFNNSYRLIDNWPFILIVITTIFTLLTFIDWQKMVSKRTIQKDMKRY